MYRSKARRTSTDCVRVVRIPTRSMQRAGRHASPAGCLHMTHTVVGPGGKLALFSRMARGSYQQLPAGTSGDNRFGTNRFLGGGVGSLPTQACHESTTNRPSSSTTRASARTPRDTQHTRILLGR